MDKPHKKLKAWQLAVDIAEKIYAITQSFPDDEKFALVRQMLKCAVSVPSNIADGAGRNIKKEFVNFLHIAQGSLVNLILNWSCLFDCNILRKGNGIY